MNEEKAKLIMEKISKRFEHIKDLKELYEFKVEQLGKKGEITALQAGIKDAIDKRDYGRLVNMVKTHFNQIYEEKIKLLEEFELKKKLESEKIDITLPSKKIRRGTKHPMTMTIEKIEDLFVSMGYDVVDGPELETDEFCFERLNLPKNHPARDMQDSFYITEDKPNAFLYTIRHLHTPTAYIAYILKGTNEVLKHLPHQVLFH